MVFAGDEGDVREWVRRSQNGERRAFDELVAHYKTRALGFVVSMIGNIDDARDILQEGFLRAYTHIGRFRGEAKFQTWFYRILINLTRDKIRKNRRARNIFAPMESGRDDAPDPPEAPDEAHTIQREIFGKEAARLLGEAVAALPEQQRLVFSMRYFDGMKLDDVARVLGCRVGTVKAHLFRATGRLRGKLGHYIRTA